MTLTRRGRSRGLERGQSLVEMALVLPVFVFLALILFDFGRVIYAQQTLNANAREATRVGSVSVASLSSAADWTARYAAIRAAARKSSVAIAVTDVQVTGAPMSTWPCDPLDPTCPYTACPVPLPADPVTPGFCFYPDGYLSASIDPGSVYVRITVQYPILTPVISNIIGGSITLTGTSKVEIHS